jgi:hypothetical protein
MAKGDMKELDKLCSIDRSLVERTARQYPALLDRLIDNFVSQYKTDSNVELRKYALIKELKQLIIK